MIARGKNASDLFPAVVKNVACKNIEVRKILGGPGSIPGSVTFPVFGDWLEYGGSEVAPSPCR